MLAFTVNTLAFAQEGNKRSKYLLTSKTSSSKGSIENPWTPLIRLANKAAAEKITFTKSARVSPTADEALLTEMRLAQ